MRRQLAKLSARRVVTVGAGKHSDGGGLYLVVDQSGARRWVFIFRWKPPGTPGSGKLREMGLGSFNSVSLGKAREKAAKAREMVAEGRDPIAAKKASKPTPTFGAIADGVFKVKSQGLRSELSVARWKRALEDYAVSLREIPVDQVSTQDVVLALQSPPKGKPDGPPLWSRAPESGKLARAYIEAVLNSAKAMGLRSGDNPARWKGHLDQLLSSPAKRQRGHHAAMPYGDVPGFLIELKARESFSARALEFLILTASRSGEVIGVRPAEIDLGSKIWTIPKDRMKSGREHRVPLSSRAIELLELANLEVAEGYIFHGKLPKDQLSNMALAMLMRRMKLVHYTVHGFRSAFRDWAGEETDHPREVSEAALAHAIGDETERAYRRGDALEKRRKLMEDWESFCLGFAPQNRDKEQSQVDE